MILKKNENLQPSAKIPKKTKCKLKVQTFYLYIVPTWLTVGEEGGGEEKLAFKMRKRNWTKGDMSRTKRLPWFYQRLQVFSRGLQFPNLPLQFGKSAVYKQKNILIWGFLTGTIPNWTSASHRDKWWQWWVSGLSWSFECYCTSTSLSTRKSQNFTSNWEEVGSYSPLLQKCNHFTQQLLYSRQMETEVVHCLKATKIIRVFWLFQKQTFCNQINLVKFHYLHIYISFLVCLKDLFMVRRRGKKNCL